MRFRSIATFRSLRGEGSYLAALLIAAAMFRSGAAAEPSTADDYERRGSAHFIAGRFIESVADFDAEIRLDSRRAPWHWKRGISLYYAGRYADGAKQFEGYQTVDGNDVENAVWRFLCQARDENVGVERARKGILPIKNDRRVPMMQVYDLFRGELKPADVLAAARSGAPTPAELAARLFYANLYVGLYYDALGEPTAAKPHLDAAAARAIDHYMGDVARVHARLAAKE